MGQLTFSNSLINTLCQIDLVQRARLVSQQCTTTRESQRKRLKVRHKIKQTERMKRYRLVVFSKAIITGGPVWRAGPDHTRPSLDGMHRGDVGCE